MAYKSAKEVLKDFDTAALSKIAFDSPDWPTAIMVGQLLELKLEQMILASFINEPQTKEQLGALFGNNGPLATFYSKILLGYAMGVISKASRDDLSKLRTIRNAAAHRITEFSFSDPEIVATCNSLILVDPASTEGMKKALREKWEQLGTSSPRAKFILSALNVILDMAELLILPKIEHLVVVFEKIFHGISADQMGRLQMATKKMRDAIEKKKRDSWPEKSQPLSPRVGPLRAQKKKTPPNQP